MSNHDFYIHIIGGVLSMILGFISLRIKDERLKRMFSYTFVLVFGVLLADAVMHLLSNAIAGFIFQSYHHYIPINSLRGK